MSHITAAYSASRHFISHARSFSSSPNKSLVSCLLSFMSRNQPTIVYKTGKLPEKKIIHLTKEELKQRLDNSFLTRLQEIFKQR